jgi:hypothetical protein
MVKNNSKNLEREKNYPTCPICQKTFSSCLIVAGKDGQNYHPQCLEIKKERENNPYLFAKVEELEREIREMRNNGKS